MTIKCHKSIGHEVDKERHVHTTRWIIPLQHAIQLKRRKRKG